MVILSYHIIVIIKESEKLMLRPQAETSHSIGLEVVLNKKNSHVHCTKGLYRGVQWVW